MLDMAELPWWEQASPQRVVEGTNYQFKVVVAAGDHKTAQQDHERVNTSI